MAPVHDPAELLPHVVSGFEGSVVDEVVVTPLGVLHVLERGEEKGWMERRRAG